LAAPKKPVGLFLDRLLMLCHAYKLGLADGQKAVGAKRGGKRIDEYFDDKRQSPRSSDPRPGRKQLF